MNCEIEIKYVIKNPEEVREKLEKTAKFVKEKKQKDEYFSPAGRDFFKKIPAKEYLRIRHNKESGSLAYFYPDLKENGDVIQNNEFESKVDDPGMVSEILKRVGTELSVTVDKTRWSYDFEDFEICLDHVEGLGWFIEVEAKKIIDDVESTRKECYEVLKKIKVEGKDVTSLGGYPDMILKPELIK